MIARRVGSTVLSVIATVLAADALGQQSAAGTAVLSGSVVRSDIAARPPVGRVVVRLDAGDNRGPRQTMTDDEGRFEFAQLPTGRFLLTASKTGWVTTYYGSPRPGRPPGVRIAVTEGSKVVIEVPIVMGSVIAGRIVDESGQPMAREFPILLEQRLVGDRQMLARMRMPFGVGFFERGANDLGEFRLFGLPPGTYHLLVTPTITSGARLTTPDEVRWALQPPGAAGAPPPQGSVAGVRAVLLSGYDRSSRKSGDRRRSRRSARRVGVSGRIRQRRTRRRCDPAR